MASGTKVKADGKIVTRVLGPATLYVEDSGRASGIRVQTSAPSNQAVNNKVSVTGTVAVNENGEVYLGSDSITSSGTGSVKPLMLRNRDIGGGPLGLQDGVWSWTLVGNTSGGYDRVPVQSIGLNNIGLLVTAFGKIEYAGDGFFYINDGSNLDDDSGHTGVKVLAAGLSFPSTGYARVTGISSCEKVGDKLFRVLRARKQGDIVVY
jgi:hypothetical protein